jgi:hypothetical protein
MKPKAKGYLLIYRFGVVTIKYFEAQVLLFIAILSCFFLDATQGILALLLGIVLILLGRRLFDVPALRKRELEKLKTIYEEEIKSMEKDASQTHEK